MNVLVVGGAGYIGSATSRLLIESGHRVVALDNLSKGHLKAIPESAVYVEGDLGDAGLIGEVIEKHQIDVAMHFAAFTEVGESVGAPEAYFENNTVRTKTLIDALRAGGVNKFVFSSTAATYGEPSEIPIPEDHPKSPTNPYGWSKLMVEEILRSYQAAYGFQFAALRYFNACGAFSEDAGEDHTPESHLIPLVLQVALGQRENIKMFGDDWPTPDGTCIRDYVHVRDIASAHIKAIDWMDRTGDSGVFNLGNGRGHSVKEIVEAARRVTGHPIPAVPAPRRPGDPARLVASSERARKLLGWTPETPKIEDIVASAWAWHSKHPKGYDDSE